MWFPFYFIILVKTFSLSNNNVQNLSKNWVKNVQIYFVRKYFVQKYIRYQHHHLNYKEILENGLVPNGLKINKRPAVN